MKTSIKIASLLITGCIMLACASEGCYDDTEANVIINLRETDAETISKIDSITIYGLGSELDSIYTNASILKADLPLNADAGYSEFVIINGLIADTIRIHYSSNLWFVSKACGYSYNHILESVEFTKNRIDTVLIINESVTIADEENIRTFF